MSLHPTPQKWQPVQEKEIEKQITKNDIYEIYRHAAMKVIVNDTVILDQININLIHFKDSDSMDINDYIGFCLQLIMLEAKKQITFIVEDKLSELVGENICLTERMEFVKK